MNTLLHNLLITLAKLDAIHLYIEEKNDYFAFYSFKPKQPRRKTFVYKFYKDIMYGEERHITGYTKEQESR